MNFFLLLIFNSLKLFFSSFEIETYPRAFDDFQLR